MNKLNSSTRITRSIRTGLAAAALAGVGIAGAGIAGASTIKPIGPIAPTGPVVREPLTTCAAPVSLSTTYSYTDNPSTDEVLSLSGSGCSQSGNPVKVSVTGPGGNWSTTVTPKPVPGTLEYGFSFTDSDYTTLVANGKYYLTYNAAFLHFFAQLPLQATVTFTASQAASGGTSNTWFTLYWDYYPNMV
jgi:hypothetical protein